MEILAKIVNRKRNNILAVLLITLVSLIPVRAFFHPGFIKSHDGEIHIARLASFNKSLFEGNILPRWGSNLNNGYGHPTLMFLYPLPNYLGAVFYLSGFSYTDSVKALFIIGYVLSGIFFYFFLKKLFDGFSAFMGMLVFLFSPYRFVDMFVRGALPEHLFFTFAALSLYLFLIFLENPDKKRYFLLTISLACLILVHNASALFFFPFLVFFNLIVAYFLLNKRLKLSLIMILTPFIGAVIITSFHWIPSIIEGKYTLRHIISTKEFTVSHLVNIKQLFSTNWGYGDPLNKDGMSLQIGLFNSLVFLIFIGVIKSAKKLLKIISTYSVIMFILFTFLMTKFSKFIWLSNNFLYNIRFPWRVLVVISLISGLITCLLFFTFSKRRMSKNRQFITGFIVYLTLIFLTFNYQKPSGFIQKEDGYYINEYSGTGDTGESSPIWSTISSEYKKKPSFEVIEGKVNISLVNKLSEAQYVNIKVEDNKARILANTLYFPGWTVYDNNVDVTSQIEFQDPAYRGLMTFWLSKGDHAVKLLFRNTKVREYSKLISLFGLLVFLLPFNRFKPNKKISNLIIK